MPTFKHLGSVAIAAAFVLALAIDAADARRGGGGGFRGGGGYGGGGGMRAGGFGGGGRAGFVGSGPRGPHVSQPIARPGIGNRPGWGNNRPGWGNRPGYGYGYGRGLGYVGAAAGLAYGAGYYGDYYGDYDNAGAYQATSGYQATPDDAVAECARRFKTYDPASQTYIRSKGVRASCP